MSLEFPALVYKNKGPHLRAGGTYSILLVSTEKECAEAKSNGWHENLLDAISNNFPTLNTAIDNAPPTREELEIKAKELGIDFHHRTSDKNLQTKIDEALLEKSSTTEKE